jgi:tetratricopeptide (TPR) repeat protein
MKLSEREEFILRKLVGRELKEARKEFFGSPYPEFSSNKSAKAELKRFDGWYQTKRKHIDPILNSVYAFEDYDGVAMSYPDSFAFSSRSKFTEAYGLVFDAMKLLKYQTKDKDRVAARLLDEALKLDPNNDEALYVMSDYTMLIDPLGAERFVDRLIKVDPIQPLAYTFKANIIMLKARTPAEMNLKEALKNIERSYMLDPDNFDTVATYAQICYWLKDKKYLQLILELKNLDSERATRFVKEHFIYAVPESEDEQTNT